MRKFAVFRIAGEIFGISLDRVVEIIRSQKVFSLPGLPAFLTGVISVRGAVIPLIDLRRRFGVQPTGKKERIIIVRSENEKIGFLVDEMREIMNLAPEDISNPPALFRGFRADYLSGLGKKGEVIVILLRIDSLLTSEERIKLAASMETIGEVEGA